MRQAKRLFSKSPKISIQDAPSSIFKSKIARDLPNQSKRSPVGPGQYNIAFPIVKPKFEAIRKNNNTIIVKVNEKLSPVFQSIQPRFKASTDYKHENNNTDSQFYALTSNNNNQNATKRDKISIGMRNRLQKLMDILNHQNSAKMIARASFDSTKKLESIQGSEQIVNSIKLYKKQRERLHFLLKNIRNKAISKGTQWSRYRQTKGNLYTPNIVPGPGSYNQTKYQTTNRYMSTIQDKSWQFKSLTKRKSFGKLNDEKQYQICPSKNRFINDINGKFYKVDSIPLIKDQSSTQIDIDSLQL